MVDKINNSKEIVNFVLVDADHEFNGVYDDLTNLLNLKPKDDLVILIHDSWYTPSRLAICAIPWNDNPYVHFIDTDYVSGDIMQINGKKQYMSGFCLVLLSPEKRQGNVRINQSQDYMYCKVNEALGNQI